MTKRLLLFALCLTVVLTACANPVYVRRFEPVTTADSVRVYADSLAWELRQENTRQGGGLLLATLAAAGMVYFLARQPR